MSTSFNLILRVLPLTMTLKTTDPSPAGATDPLSPFVMLRPVVVW